MISYLDILLYGAGVVGTCVGLVVIGTRYYVGFATIYKGKASLKGKTAIVTGKLIV